MVLRKSIRCLEGGLEASVFAAKAFVVDAGADRADGGAAAAYDKEASDGTLISSPCTAEFTGTAG